MGSGDERMKARGNVCKRGVKFRQLKIAGASRNVTAHSAQSGCSRCKVSSSIVGIICVCARARARACYTVRRHSATPDLLCRLFTSLNQLYVTSVCSPYHALHSTRILCANLPVPFSYIFIKLLFKRTVVSAFK
jgi:hypothetical protein